MLADEVNRAPAKVQSALLEAMGERQVTVGTRDLPAAASLFLVMATQNPIEQEGTYPLPEAQLDRFLMHVRVDYPDAGAERRILAIARERGRVRAGHSRAPACRQPGAIFAAREEVFGLYMAPKVEDYLVHLVMATRDPRPTAESSAPGGLRRQPARHHRPGPLRPRPRLAARAGTTSRPRTSRPWPPTCCATASWSATRPRPRGSTPDDFVTALLARVPMV